MLGEFLFFLVFLQRKLLKNNSAQAGILMSGQAKVSVIIPTYNRVASLKLSLQSVLCQTYKNIEVIVVDDCSQDETQDYLNSIADPRVRHLRNLENKGAAASRNIGIHAAQGDLVAFQDSDDVWLHDFLEKLIIEIYKDDMNIACYSGVVRVSDGSAAYFPEKQFQRYGDIRDALLSKPFIGTQRLIVKREKLINLGGFDEQFPVLEEWDLTLELSKIGRFGFVNKPLVIQIKNDSSISRNVEKEIISLQLFLAKHSSLYNKNPKIYSSLLRYISILFLVNGQGQKSKNFALKSLSVLPWGFKSWAFLIYVYAKTFLGARV